MVKLIETLRDCELPPTALPDATAARGHGRRALWLRELPRVLVCILQFALMVQLLRVFQLESRAFRVVTAIACVAFPIHHFLPLRLRMPFFSLVSIASIVSVVGAWNAGWIVLLGGVLIGMAHLPIKFWSRVGLQLAFVTLLGAMRIDAIASPIPAVIWPVLGAMFMFRLLVYMYDLKTKAAPFDVWRSLTYFFMLPNACFTLLPVIDYRSLQSSYYSEPNVFGTYQRGLRLMLRGVLHLLLYRLVYQELLVDPAGVSSAGGALRFLVGTLFLYLRISGYFHFIGGLLHMFGFNLPATHHLYFLASSFTDFWRRINIYWKDFMQKVFFYPLQLPLGKRVGTVPALVITTTLVFLCTWFLHAYQWFWLRGRFPLTAQDALFWGGLGVAVLINMLIELRFPPRRSLKAQARSLRSGLTIALKTIATFLAITLIWNIWSTDDLGDLAVLLSQLAHVGAGDALWIGGGAIALGASAIWLGHRPRPLTSALPATSRESAIAPAVLGTVALAGLLLLLGMRPLTLSFYPDAVTVLQRLADPRLNERDSKLLQRGYYEELADPTRVSAELSELYGHRPADWEKPTYMKLLAGFPCYEPIPGANVTFTGVPFHINRWGMRDKDYAQEKPPDTLRMVALGASHTEGQGVPIEQVYHSLVEDRLNRELTPASGRRYEILNLASGGYGPGSSLATLEKRGFAFAPDIVLFHVIDDFEWVRNETALHVAGKGLKLPYDFAMRVVERAGVFAGLNRSVAEQRLVPHVKTLVRFYYERLRAEALEHGATAFVVVIPIPEDQSDVQADIDQQIEIAKEVGLHVIDIRSAYRGMQQRSDLWTRRFDHHPNPHGHRLLAEALYHRLLPVLVH